MTPPLKLLVKGFELFENRIIETTIKLSKKRSPHLQLLNEDEINAAEIIIIDGKDGDALNWAANHYDNFDGKVIIWVDAAHETANPSYIFLKRPILWVNLPIILSRILDDRETQMLESTESVLEPFDSDPTASNSKAPSILVVDDSQPVRDYLHKILSGDGYDVYRAEDGETALEHIKKHDFKCILMDVLMPGIDGYKTCREIRKSNTDNQSAAIVMLTSKTSPFDKIKGKMAGCDDYLTKPVKMSTLLNSIKQYA